MVSRLWRRDEGERAEKGGKGRTHSVNGKHEGDRTKDRQLELVERQAIGRDGDEEADHDGQLKEDVEPLSYKEQEERGEELSQAAGSWHKGERRTYEAAEGWGGVGDCCLAHTHSDKGYEPADDCEHPCEEEDVV